MAVVRYGEAMTNFDSAINQIDIRWLNPADATMTLTSLAASNR